jgi:hypothetical protein
MSQIGAVFVANLNADKIFIDMSNIPDPTKHTFKLRIQNQANTGLYFKIVCNVSNWSIYAPTNGQLGSVGSGSTADFDVTISRTKPSTETTDTGYFTIQAFTDSGYVNKVAEANLNATVYFEDLENWTDVIISNFNDGTAQGWTLGTGLSILNNKSVETGGYSVESSILTGGSRTFYIEKTITIPNRNKVRLNFYLACRISNTHINTAYAGHINSMSIKCGGNKVFEIVPIIFGGSIYQSNTYLYGWSKFCGDLSAYKGQTVTVRIEFVEYSQNTYIQINSWLDRVVIAGKD